MTLQEQQQREMMANQVRRYELFGNTPGYQGITPQQYQQYTQALGVQGRGAGNQTAGAISTPSAQPAFGGTVTQPGGGGLSSAQPAFGGTVTQPGGGGLSSAQPTAGASTQVAFTHPEWSSLTPEQRRMYGGDETSYTTIRDFNIASAQPWIQRGLNTTIDPAIVAKLQAARKANPTGRLVGGESDGGVWYTSDPSWSVDGYSIGEDGSIGKSLKKKTWGQDVTASYDDQGRLIGIGSGDSTALGLTKFVLGSVGAYYGTGALNGMTGAGAATGGAGSGSIGGLNGIEFGAGLDGGATLTGGSALTSGGTPAFGTTLADATIGVGGGGALGSSLAGQTYGGFMPDVGGGASSLFQIGGSPTMPSTPNPPNRSNPNSPPASPPNSNNPGGNTPNLGNLNGWQQLGALAGGALASGAAANALSNPANTSRYDALFDNLLREQGKISARGDDQWANYLSTFRPVEQKFATSALNYDTPERRAMAAREAQNAVASEFDIQRQGFNEEATRYGMDPTTIAAMGNASRLEEAKARAGASNQARNQVEMQGLGLLQNAAQFGRNLPNTANQASSIATGTAGQAAQIAGQQANIQNQNTQNRNALFGDLLGAGLTAWGMYQSSKKSKKVGSKVDGLAAAKAIEKSPAKKWAYKPGQGDGSGKQRMGPMAEDLKREAPGVSDGKQVDAISQLGLHHAAIGNLNKRIRKLEKQADGVYAEA